MMRHPVRAALALSILSLAACDLSRIGLGGSDPGLIAPTNIDPAPDSTGIIKFDAFQVLVAREGDTISTMAERVTVDEVVLARYNGLPLNYKLQPGERLALPNDAQVAAVEQGWTPEVVTGVLDDLPDAPQPPAPTEAPGTQLVRHVVEPGETAYSIARLYRVAVTALASWNGLDKDLSVVEGRSLIIPPQPEQNTTVASLDPEIPDVAPPTTQPGEGTPLPPPPSAATPLPENTPKPAEPLTGPDLSQDTITPALQGFAMPVQGEVIKPYSPAAPLPMVRSHWSPARSAGSGQSCSSATAMT